MKKLTSLFLLLVVFSSYAKAESDISKTAFSHFIFKGVTSDTTVTEEKGIDGTASFYANFFEGLKTANGDIFSHSKLTAASNFFPLNTLVKITNLRNGYSVLVKITDRMHPNMTNKGRIIDLTMAAAKKIHLLTSSGLAKVNVQKVEEED